MRYHALSDNHSFPAGYTSLAEAGARKEFGQGFSEDLAYESDGVSRGSTGSVSASAISIS